MSEPHLTIEIRTAGDHDLDAIVGLTAEHRNHLAEWAPAWWRKADGADELHPLWLGYLIGNEEAVVRVVEANGDVVGCAISMPQGAQWFIDDIAVDAERWGDAGVALLRAVPERPAVTCVPIQDHGRIAAARAAGLAPVSTYWIRATEPDRDQEDARARAPSAFSVDADLPAAPPHSFGGPFDPFADGALAFSHRAGVVIGSPSTPPPPIYGAGETVTVVDRVVGSDRAALVREALVRAARRGDIVLNVVVGADDRDLEELVHEAEFTPLLDVYRWPE